MTLSVLQVWSGIVISIGISSDCTAVYVFFTVGRRNDFSHQGVTTGPGVDMPDHSFFQNRRQRFSFEAGGGITGRYYSITLWCVEHGYCIYVVVFCPGFDFNWRPFVSEFKELWDIKEYRGDIINSFPGTASLRGNILKGESAVVFAV